MISFVENRKRFYIIWFDSVCKPFQEYKVKGRHGAHPKSKGRGGEGAQGEEENNIFRVTPDEHRSSSGGAQGGRTRADAAAERGLHRKTTDAWGVKKEKIYIVWSRRTNDRPPSLSAPIPAQSLFNGWIRYLGNKWFYALNNQALVNLIFSSTVKSTCCMTNQRSDFWIVETLGSVFFLSLSQNNQTKLPHKTESNKWYSAAGARHCVEHNNQHNIFLLERNMLNQ